MIYDITSADNAYKWILKFLDINGDDFIDEYLIECDSDNDIFIDRYINCINEWDIENTDFVVIHVTSSDDECEEIREYGIINLQKVLSKDTKLKNIFSKYGVQFNIDEKLMTIGERTYSIDYNYYKNISDSNGIEHYKSLREISRRLYCDAQVNGFFFSKNVKAYGTYIHERPEFILCFSTLLDNISDMEREWKSSCVGYEIKYKARFNEFAWCSFYDNKDSFYDDGENNRLDLKKKLFSIALDIAHLERSGDMYAYMKSEAEIKNEQILECTRIN